MDEGGAADERDLRTLFIMSTAKEAHTVATYRQVGCPAASIAAMFFFHRRFMIRYFFPGGEKVVLTPQGEEPETWMSVLA